MICAAFAIIAISEVLRHGPRDRAIRCISRPKQYLEVWQRPPAPHILAGQPGRRAETGQQLPRQVERYIAQDRHNPDLRRKAYTAIAAKMARTIHAVIKSGEPYRPFFEGGEPRRKDPSL